MIDSVDWVIDIVEQQPCTYIVYYFCALAYFPLLFQATQDFFNGFFSPFFLEVFIAFMFSFHTVRILEQMVYLSPIIKALRGKFFTFILY